MTHMILLLILGALVVSKLQMLLWLYILAHRDLSQDANVFTEINWDYLSCVLDFNLKGTLPLLLYLLL